MDDVEQLNSDILLEKLGKCGIFQIVLILLTSVAMIPGAFTYLVMSFGIYNPGWRCSHENVNASIDNNTLVGDGGYKWMHSSNTSSWSNNVTSGEFIKDSCEGYSACQEVEFNPEASTVLTEWGLACDSAWVLSTLMSLQMAGNMAGSLITGYIGDRFGRKVPLHISTGIIAVLNLISYFSVNWEMYGTILLLIGFFSSFRVLSTVLIMEYLPERWRVRYNSLPTWSFVSILFAVFAMTTKDWKTLRLIASVSGFITAALFFWVPKSLRFLIVRGRTEEAVKVAKRIAKINKVEVLDKESVESLLQNDQPNGERKRSYTMLHLFRKGYILPTIIIGFICLTFDLTYFVFSFGVSTMPGNLYTNMMIFAVTDLPANILGLTVANIFNRKPSILAFHMLAALLLVVVVALDFTTTGSVKAMSIQATIMTSKVFLYVAWIVFFTLCNELYPTVVRSTFMTYLSLTSNIGSIVAPFLIPTDPSTFYISYLTMAILNIIGALCVLLLPETKGRPMTDTWDDGQTGGGGVELRDTMLTAEERQRGGSQEF